MKTLRFFILAAPLLLAGCPGGGPGGGGSTTRNLEKAPLGAAPSPSSSVQLCEKNCEKAPLDMKVISPNWKPLQLNPAEASSLSHALTSGKPPQHLDASVLDGKLVFTSHTEAAHVGTSTTVLAFPGQHATVMVVATPEAAALLKIQAHN